MTGNDRRAHTATRLDSLTGLRFVAAFMVFWWHAAEHLSDFPLPPFNRSLAPHYVGATGVVFFFILSGFVLAWSQPDDERPSQFYRRRFARIYPNYLVVWALALVVGWQERTLVGALLSGTLLQAWVPSADVYFAVHAVLWTLSVEAFFYAVFPWLLPRLRRLDRGTRRFLLAAIPLATLLIGVLAFPATEGTFRFWLAVIFPPVRLLEFVLGMLLALEVREGLSVRLHLAPALALAAAALALAATGTVHATQDSLMVVPFAVLIVAAAQQDLAGGPSIFATRPFLRLGAWSYAFYLIHTILLFYAVRMPAELADRLAGAGVVGGLAATVAACACAVLASYALFTAVERPLERRLRPAGKDRVSAGPAHSAGDPRFLARPGR